MLDIVGVPFDDCGRRSGSRLGPLAVRMAGLLDDLKRIGVECEHRGLLFPVSGEPTGGVAESATRLPSVLGKVKAWSADACARGDIPFMIGGDHSLSMGSISGALEKYGDGLAVLWIDAHMDLNTPHSSPSGNMHGMTLAALARLLDTDETAPANPSPEALAALTQSWRQILGDVVPKRGLAGHRMAWVGLRDVDLGESRSLKNLDGALALTMQEVDQGGLPACLQHIEAWLLRTNPTALWVSFDVDSIDPFFAPGTGTAVRGGFTYREAQLIAETLNRWLMGPNPICPLAGLDVVEVNPLADHSNETAIMATEWTASLFGKTILRDKELEVKA